MECKDYTHSHQQFYIQRCEACHLLLTNPRPDQTTIGKYYKSEEYISHTGKTNSLFDWIYLRARTFTLKWKQNIITSRKPQGRILDYGCGTGEFVNQMAQNNWEALAIEPSDEARIKALQLSKSSNLSVYKTIAELPEKKFDVITLWHVLEHVPHPDQLIHHLKKKLNEDGLIFVAVPNYTSYDAAHYKNHWAAYDVPRHFWHFAPNHMAQLLTNSKLKLKETLPMKLDAYYVSLLSEKYRNNSKHSWVTPIKAILTALKSNAKARKTLNYSSLIYIAGHA